MNVPSETVWSVLSDPRQYGRFVVGTKRIRRFAPSWPEEGAELHHTIGVGLTVLRDATRVVDMEPQSSLRLSAGMGVLGVSTIVFTVEAAGPDQTRVTIKEEPAGGLLHLVWNPVLDTLMRLRNDELLRRLRRIAEHQATTTASSGGSPHDDGGTGVEA